MAIANRLEVTSYGVLFHGAIAASIAGIGAANKAGISGRFYATTVPALLVAAAILYATAVAPYVARRSTGKGRGLFDCAVGMMAEVGILILTVALWGAIASWPVLGAEGVVNYFGAAGYNAFYALLWAIGNFTTQLLVLGNAAGFVGFLLLRLRERKLAR